ncbi:hypothetical protein TNCV_3938221 [Trichonephila clavipes]|nr:hypothetical protein TNCV_3938221 [Trichonephila clavipes]
MREKFGDLDYMMDALKLTNKYLRVSVSHYRRVWHGVVLIKYFFCWPILAVSGRQSLASNGPVVDNRYLNLVFGHMEATHNKLFLSSHTKYAVEPSWPLNLVWPLFELLHHALCVITITFAQYCRTWPISYSQSPSV